LRQYQLAFVKRTYISYFLHPNSGLHAIRLRYIGIFIPPLSAVFRMPFIPQTHPDELCFRISFAPILFIFALPHFLALFFAAIFLFALGTTIRLK
jgi:hypothetical protein